MRLKSLTSLVVLALSLSVISSVFAQSPSVEWTQWNAQITAHSGSQPFDVAETQVIRVTSGPLHGGSRDFEDPVNIQSVYLAMNGSQPTQLSQGSGAGSYTVSNSNGEIVVDYELPQAANTGDTFVVQINFTVSPPTAGIVDWSVVPANHPFPVDSSKATINFPDGQAPNASFVRVTQGSGNVSASGSSLVIQSQGALPANQPFEVQVPFGAGVGQPANGNNAPVQNAPVQNAPLSNAPTNGTSSGTSNDSGGILGNILPILCIVGLLVIFGGGSLLRGLLGGALGGAIGGGGLGGGGGIFGGGGSSNSGGGIFGGGSSGSSGRGFRQSADQNREVPTINNDKRGGGGAGFH
jgi:hypothetical protein